MTRISPNLVEYIDFRAIPHTTSQEVGGKGGGTTVSSTTYTYEVAVIFGLGEGRMQVERIWKNKEETSIGGLGFELFDGSASQPPWSYMASRHPERALAYSGTTCVAHAAFPLGNTDSLPNMTFEVRGHSGPGELGGEVSVCTPDVNPANILHDLLTHERYGAEHFMRLDGAVQRFNVTEASVGRTLYVKLLAFNTTGGGLKELDEVDHYTYQVLPLGVVATNGAVPSTITAAQALCIPPTGQYSVQGRMTCAGRINCDGRLIVS